MQFIFNKQLQQVRLCKILLANYDYMNTNDEQEKEKATTCLVQAAGYIWLILSYSNYFN